MDKDSEKYIDQKLSAWVKAEKGLCIKLMSPNITGLPDRLVMLPGAKIFFMELKTKGKKPKPLQAWFQKKLNGLGFASYIIDSYDDLLLTLDKYKNVQ